MTLWSTFFSLAFTLTAAFGLPLAQSHGAGALFVLHGALMACAAALLAWVLPADTPRSTARLSARSVLADHARIYTSPDIAAPAMGFVFYTLLFVALLTLVPAEVAPEHRALVAGAMPLASIVTSLGLGVALTRRLGAVRVVQLGFALAMVAALGWAVTLGQGVAGMTAALALSAALGLVQGASFAAIPALNATAEDRAAAAGAIAQLGNVGTTLGTPLLLALVARFGPAAISGFALPVCAAGILVHSVLTRRRAQN